MAQISTQLGLDASKFVTRSSADDEVQMDWGFKPRCMLADDERFKDCEKLRVTCKTCQTETVFPGVYGIHDTSGLLCSTCGAM